MSRAELQLNRVAFLNAEVWELIGHDKISAAATSPASGHGATSMTSHDKASAATSPASGHGGTTRIGQDKASAAAFSAAAMSSANRAGTTTFPIDLESLDAFCNECKNPQQGIAMADRAHCACVCLAVEIRLLQLARKCFDEAVELNPDLVESYRDRGVAYLALGRCEATLAAIETAIKGTAIEKALPGLKDEVAKLMPDPQRPGLPPKLERALVDGRRRFEDGLRELNQAKVEQSLIATKKQDIAYAAAKLAEDCVANAIHQGGAGAKQQKSGKAAPRPALDLLEVQDQIEQLRNKEVQLGKDLDQEEKKVREEFSKANAALNESYTTLEASQCLRDAKQSRGPPARRAILQSPTARIMAEIYASQCNFDRAQYYQKLAVIFASEDDRPQLLETYRDYRAKDAAINAKAAPMTPPSREGQGRGSGRSAAKGPAEDSGDSSD